jgi:hypothetical protein
VPDGFETKPQPLQPPEKPARSGTLTEDRAPTRRARILKPREAGTGTTT